MDIIEDILGEVGLSGYINRDSFDLARSDTLSYHIGVRFENLEAGRAIREIASRCLDIENIPLCGEEDFGKFTWWPKYRHYGMVSGAWHFNGGLTDASGNGHTLF